MSGRFDPPDKDLPPPPAPNRPLPPPRPPPPLPKKKKKFPSHTMKLKASKHLEKMPESDSSPGQQTVLGKLETNKAGEILPEIPPKKKDIKSFFGGKKSLKKRTKRKRGYGRKSSKRRTKKRKAKRTKKRRSLKRRKRKTRRR